MYAYTSGTTITDSNKCWRVLLLLSVSLALATPANAQGDRAREKQSQGEKTHKNQTPFAHGHDRLHASIPGEGPTLSELSSWANEHAPALRIARGEVSVAQAETVAANLRVPENLMLGLEAGGRTIDRTTRPEVGVSLQQPISISGARQDRMRLADASTALANAEQSLVQWSVHVQTHRLYKKAQVARRRVHQAKALKEHAQAHHDIAKRKVKAGESPPPLLLITESNLARAEALVIEAERAEEEARIKLAGWVGWKEDEVAPLPVDSPELLELPNTEELLEQMAEHHPSMDVRQAAVHAAESRSELARAQRIPNPTIGAKYSLEHEPANKAHIWRITTKIPLPFSHRNQRERARADALSELAKIRLEATSRRLRTQLLSAVASVEQNSTNVRLYQRDVIPRLNEHLDLLLRAFRAGEIDIHEVAAVHEQALQSVEEYLRILERYYTSVAHLEQLVGTELWDLPNEGQP